MWWAPTLALAAPLDLEAVRDDLVAPVERAAGRTFAGAPPPVRLVSALELGMEARREQLALATLGYPDLPPEAVEAMRYALPAPATVVAKYLLFTDEILVSSEGLAAATSTVAKAGVKRAREHLLRCALAHELVHALQDRAGAFEAAARDPERLAATNLVAEGHALLAAERVCDPAVTGPLRELLGVGEPGSTSPYSLGVAFLESRPGDPWDHLLPGPADTASVLWPDRAVLPAPEAPWAVMEEALALLAPGERVLRIQVGALDLLSAGGPGVEAPLRSMTGAWQAVAPTGAGLVAIRTLHIGDPTAVTAYLEATRAHAREVRGSGVFAVSTRPPEPVPALGDGAYAWTRSLSLLFNGAPAPWTVRGWVVARGAWVVELELFQVERKEDQVVGALSAACEALR